MIYITDYINDKSFEQSLTKKKVYHFNDVNVNKDAIEAVITWHENVDKSFLNQFKNLRFVQRYGVGFDTIDLEECKKRKIRVANVPDYGTEEVSNSAISLILNLLRGSSRYDFISRELCNKKSQTWQENVIHDLRRLSEQNLLVIGLGRIGGRVARLLTPFFNKISFYDPYVSEYDSYKKYEDLYEAIKNSDVISLHCPLNNVTSGLVDKKFINSMKKGACLVNTARGGLVGDLNELLSALKHNIIYGFATDVLVDEPPKYSDEYIKEFLKNKDLSGRLIINPHTSYYSNESFAFMRKEAIKNVNNFLIGKKIKNIIL